MVLEKLNSTYCITNNKINQKYKKYIMKYT